jgi:hypothetical protein
MSYEFEVKKAFEQHEIGDTVFLNARQAKYLQMSGHIDPVNTVIPAKSKELEEKPVNATEQAKHELELEPRSEGETDALAAGKKKAKKNE